MLLSEALECIPKTDSEFLNVPHPRLNSGVLKKVPMSKCLDCVRGSYSLREEVLLLLFTVCVT